MLNKSTKNVQLISLNRYNKFCTQNVDSAINFCLFEVEIIFLNSIKLIITIAAQRSEARRKKTFF